ncbi:MAG: hypothetical protein ACLT8E_01795 [Akkermansia sp.]
MGQENASMHWHDGRPRSFGKMGQASQGQAEKRSDKLFIMTTLNKLFISMLSAGFLLSLQEATANDDVKIDDIFSARQKRKIVNVIEHPADQVAETVIQRALEGHVKNLTQPLLMILENLTRRIIPSPSLLRRLPISVNALNMTTTKTTIFLVSLAVSVS